MSKIRDRDTMVLMKRAKEGLKRYRYVDKAREIRESLLNLIGRYGFYENFDPIKKKGCGVDDFSWTAALAIAMYFD